MTTTQTTETKKRAPKTPSPGQLRAIAKLLGEATIPSADPLLSEAAMDVATWLLYQSDIKSVKP